MKSGFEFFFAEVAGVGGVLDDDGWCFPNSIE